MFAFRGRVTCTFPPNRRGRPYTIQFNISLFPPQVAVTVSDPIYQNQHTIENSRFNFQARDSYVDLLARDAWNSVWYDRYEGILELRCPKLDRITSKLDVRIIASWDEPFVIVEFKVGDVYCQVCTRPRSGAKGWLKTRFVPESLIIPVPPRPAMIPLNQDEADPSSSSNQVDEFDLYPEIESARQTDSPSERPDSPCSSAPVRRLSSIENVSTIARWYNADSPVGIIYHADSPVEIDFDRVRITSSPRNQNINKKGLRVNLGIRKI